MEAFHAKGLENVVLCPGSRSGPLAVAVGKLSQLGRIRLITAIDERSAAFIALGLSAVSGKASAVITTSGTAVANLLPAVVEADYSCHPLLLLTADRPSRLKNCGANQTVNQEEFLKPSIRSFFEGPKEGLHNLGTEGLNNLVENSWESAHKFPGPVHVNLPLEEPLHSTCEEQEKIWNIFSSDKSKVSASLNTNNVADLDELQNSFCSLEFSQPGVVVVGPWRGKVHELVSFRESLCQFQEYSGWPIFADPLSGVSIDQPGLICNWEMILKADLITKYNNLQVLRLGPTSSSRALEKWLLGLNSNHLVISEGDIRCLDYLGLARQFNYGFTAWWNIMRRQSFYDEEHAKTLSSKILSDFYKIDLEITRYFDFKFPFQGNFNEPAIAYWLPRLIPKSLSIMLSASSPIRDCLTYSGRSSLSHRCFGFRGASGIDGTLSLAMGISLVAGPTVLVTGDLALLHDSNGWLFSSSQETPLIVFLIDNQGGGIFEQIPINTFSREYFEKLFSMPQDLNFLELANAYQVPFRQIASFDDLQFAIEWALAQSGTVLLRVCTNRINDASFRKSLLIDLVNYFEDANQNGFISS